MPWCRSRSKLTLEQIAREGKIWHEVTGRHPFFNYCAHDGNSSVEDADRLRALFDPQVWNATISVVCERSEGMPATNEHQRAGLGLQPQDRRARLRCPRVRSGRSRHDRRRLRTALVRSEMDAGPPRASAAERWARAARSSRSCRLKFDPLTQRSSAQSVDRNRVYNAINRFKQPSGRSKIKP
jgi:hypothetical protein